nr:hypothetical protein Iba_chr10cCG11440 [Ipomoea batatas]
MRNAVAGGCGQWGKKLEMRMSVKGMEINRHGSDMETDGGNVVRKKQKLVAKSTKKMMVLSSTFPLAVMLVLQALGGHYLSTIARGLEIHLCGSPWSWSPMGMRAIPGMLTGEARFSDSSPCAEFLVPAAYLSLPLELSSCR